MMNTRPLAAAVLCFLLALPAARSQDDLPTMPVSEIKPGMRGEWHTVVTGTRIDSFPMEVVGVVENFVGPQRPVIVCKALDATNKLTGPVAGMSGSPTFIDGKLIGAYAYGWTFPKDQALFGVTPIEDMLEVGTYQPAPVEAKPKPLAASNHADPLSWLTPSPANSSVASLPSLVSLRSICKPLPTPLFVSGISERSLRRFSRELDDLGIEMIQAPAGRATHSFDTELKPGSAVSGVLMGGDFDITGTGTVTWRKGNRILAFGHPFLQAGAIEMPMAAAEILTVVQSVQRSFKLPNIGPVVGSIYQDRLTAIAGEIGRTCPTTRVEIQVNNTGGGPRSYRGDLFQHQRLSPTLSAIALLESLGESVEATELSTIDLDTTIEVQGYDPVQLADASSGTDSEYTLALRQLQLYASFLGNPCEFPKVKSIVFKARRSEGWKSTALDSLEIDRNSTRPGASVEAFIGLRNYRDQTSVVPVTIPIPADVRAPELQLFVGDADAALAMDDVPHVTPATLGQVIDRLRKLRSHRNICVKLLRLTPGVAIEGQPLPDLPPSVSAEFASPNSSSQRGALSRVTLWETNFPVQGTFNGQKIMPVKIE